MKPIKHLVVLVLLVVVAGAIANSWAQCTPGRLFRSSGKLGNNLDFDVTGTDNNGNQIGYFWDSDDANNSNSGFAPDYGVRCPVNQWWAVRTPPNLMQIDGVQGAVGCAAAGMGCPTNKLTIVVEDYAEGGPPGVYQDAYYAAYMVDETPASGRWYDYGNLDGIDETNAIIPMLPFPEVVITSVSIGGGHYSIAYNLVDQTDMVHSTHWAAGGGLFPTTAIIREYQLVIASAIPTGTVQPGRARSNGWVTIRTIPYVPGGTPQTVSIPYPPTGTEHYLAIGIGFNGGAYGVIDSALVGRAFILPEPILADPEWPADFDHKPSSKQREPRSLRPEGRR